MNHDYDEQKWGGHVEEFPHLDFETSPREYDDKPRPVTVSISTYGGVVVGATHWFVTITEAGNLIRDDKDKVWRRIWRDPNYSGLKFERRHTNRDRLVRWAAGIIRKHFGTCAHVLADCGYDDCADGRDCVDAGEECGLCEVRRALLA